MLPLLGPNQSCRLPHHQQHLPGAQPRSCLLAPGLLSRQQRSHAAHQHHDRCAPQPGAKHARSSTACVSTATGSSNSCAAEGADLTALASSVLQHGNGVARRILSDPQLEGAPLEFLKQTEAYWKALKQQKHEPHKPGPTVITTSTSTVQSTLLLQQQANSNARSSSSTSTSRPLSFGAAPHGAAAASTAGSSNAHNSPNSSSSYESLDFDVVMCGGTLGICVALALQQKGFRVAVVEKRRVEGRLQEWNTSRHEVQVLVDMGLLSQSELEAAIKSEFKPIRVGFKGGAEPLAVNNVLNLGVCPKTLIALMRSHFEVLGGVVFEQTAFKSAVVCSDGVVVSLLNAASSPAGVGDTNRPNALQRQQQQKVVGQRVPLFEAAVAGGVGVGGGERSAPAASSSNGHIRSSSSNGEGLSRGAAHNSSSSRYDRWLSAAAHSNGSNRSTPHLNSHTNGVNGTTSSSSSSSSQAQQDNRADASAAASNGHNTGRRAAPSKLTCRLVLDCMGHYSPIVKQLRGKAKPDGMVLVVGGCATGFAPESNTSGDLLCSITDASADMQLFWEAFPAEGGAARTTYMFAYSDADERRPSFEKLLDTYFTLLPAYQGLPSLDAVQYKRVLFGGFPCYSKATPLSPGFDRVLQLGDASATQSPLSFGGFGSLLRHISRLSTAISHALQDDKLGREQLAWIHPYQPSLSAAWLFQRSMSLKVGQQQQQQQQQEEEEGGTQAQERAPAGAAAAAASTHAASTSSSSTSSSSGSGASSASASASPTWLQKLLQLPANHINALLGCNFAVLAVLGQRALKPFLQDTLQLLPLAATMWGMMIVKPLVIARVLVQVGPKVLLGWFGHFAMLTLYTLGYHLSRPFRHVSNNYTLQRVFDALQYGSSSDYRYSAAPIVNKASPSATTTTTSSSKDRLPEQELVQQQQPSAGVGADTQHVRSRGKTRQGAAANNIVPAVPAAWAAQVTVQQQPNAA